MSEYLRRPTTQRVTEDAQVTPLELFDLVFVYALTQTTALMASNVSVEGLARGFVVLALVWWCWVGYSWLGNQAQADEGIVRVAFIVVMMAMFVLALTIPETWGDLPGGLEAPVVFALCYLVIRVAHLGLYWIAAAGDTGLRRTLRLFAATALGSSAVPSPAACGGSISTPPACSPSTAWPTRTMSTRWRSDGTRSAISTFRWCSAS
ncbi:hypothetical protein BH18ACT3_BH18ACT3_05570 [soil metagenome]